jgi:hypothetical protein
MFNLFGRKENHITVKSIQYISDGISYIIPTSRWSVVIVLDVHAPTVDKTNNTKVCAYEELKRVFDIFPKYHMKFRLGDFNAKGG